MQDPHTSHRRALLLQAISMLRSDDVSATDWHIWLVHGNMADCRGCGAAAAPERAEARFMAEGVVQALELV